MKFFNPFRWHVVKYDGIGYCIQRLSIFGWEKRDKNPHQKYTYILKPGVAHRASFVFDTLDEINVFLQEQKDQMKKKKARITPIFIKYVK